MNLSTNENDVASCSAKTLFTMSSAVNPMTISN